ncbi:MAG: septum formation inhibitor Maf [Clostridia bacterium]|nr:septum formation inhibitor Maf [Clostridia bacterium]
MKVILASASPRRKELLTLAGIEYTVIPSECEEVLPDNITPADAVEELARQKAEDVFKRHSDCMIIAADTVVALGNTILGKPKNDDDAFSMLTSLSGNIHTVYTGVCIKTADREEIFHSATDVEFYELTDKEIRDYIATKEPCDKAGAYGIQGKGSLLVKGIHGDYFNVVGLPLAETVRRINNNLAYR